MTVVANAALIRRLQRVDLSGNAKLTLAPIAVVIVGAVLPGTPLGSTLGFAPLPGAFFAALAGLVVAYLVRSEIAKWAFCRAEVSAPSRRMPYPHMRHQRRRAAQFSRDSNT